jgi:drug/metabolite transporter (DMT)-like permease
VSTSSPVSAHQRGPSTARPIFVRILRLGGILALAIAVVGGVVGFLVDGQRGLVSALIGTAMAIVFTGLTAASILVANRFAGREFFTVVFFAVVMGAWLVKFVIFLVLVFLLRDQEWINPTVLFFCIIAGVLGSLVVDVVVVARSRLGYVSDVSLPGE